MLAAVRAFQGKHRFRETGGEDMTYRIALMFQGGCRAVSGKAQRGGT